jgi:hypothetical protein
MRSNSEYLRAGIEGADSFSITGVGIILVDGKEENNKEMVRKGEITK